MQLLKWLESIRTPFGEEVWSFFSAFGEELVIICAVCALYWCVNKALAYKLGVTFFVSGLLTQGIKITARIDRPAVLDPTFKPVESAVETATGYSFPSGHTAGASAMFFPMALEVKKTWMRCAAVIMPFLVAFSRMYLGVHTLLDVSVSLAMTALVAVGAHLLLNRVHTKKAHLILSLCMLAFSAAVLIYSLILAGNGVIAAHYAVDCTKAAAAGMGFAAGYYLEQAYIRFKESCRKWYLQLIKFLGGIIGLLAIKEGLKMLLGGALWADAIRYFLLIFWIIALYPLLFTALAKSRAKKPPQ